MKRIFVSVAAVAMLLVSGTAFGIDLRNEDGREYVVQVTSSAMKKDVKVPAKAMSIVICVGKCTFQVPGVGRVKAKGSDVVTIRQGRLLHRETPQVALPDVPKKRWNKR